MRIILFYPRGYEARTNTLEVFALASAMPPLGLASIAAVLRKAGHEVTILDANLDFRPSNESWARRIVGMEPDFVGFSSTTSSFLDAYDVCRRVKELDESLHTVFGGVHVSWGQARILEDYPEIDFVVAGEGEHALLELVEGHSPASIEGLFFRDGGAIGSGPPPSTQYRMDDLPFPAYDLLDGFPDRYNLGLFSYRRHPGATVISSRGCVYRCSYCDRSVFRRSHRWNSAEYTFELLKWLRTDFGIRHVIFYDDLFTLNRKRVLRLCELLRRGRLGVTFNCIVRIGHVDPELIRELKSAGCWMVHVGIESGDDAILEEHKERLTVATIRRDVQRLHDAGLWVKGLFMLGFPGETEASIRKTMDLALSLPLKDINVTAFTPYPGAEIASRIEELGTFENDWSRMDCVEFVFVPHEIGSKEVLEHAYHELLRRFYHRRAMGRVYARMLLECPHSYWRLLRGAPAFLRYAWNLQRQGSSPAAEPVGKAVGGAPIA